VRVAAAWAWRCCAVCRWRLRQSWAGESCVGVPRAPPALFSTGSTRCAGASSGLSRETRARRSVRVRLASASGPTLSRGPTASCPHAAHAHARGTEEGFLHAPAPPAHVWGAARRRGCYAWREDGACWPHAAAAHGIERLLGMERAGGARGARGARAPPWREAGGARQVERSARAPKTHPHTAAHVRRMLLRGLRRARRPVVCGCGAVCVCCTVCVCVLHLLQAPPSERLRRTCAAADSRAGQMEARRGQVECSGGR
jgi:hypothetical protein